MICSKCNKEMRKGYLFSSKDGAFSFADEVPGVFTNAKTAKGFVEITPLKASHRTKVEACICEYSRHFVGKAKCSVFATKKVSFPHFLITF